jgi:hypothetical protein
MKTQMEMRKLTMNMNFKNSLEPHTGSRSFPMMRRHKVLATTYRTISLFVQLYEGKKKP